MMAEEADPEIYIYMGEDDVVPRNATRVRVHESIKAIPEGAFYEHPNLVGLECHDGVESVGEFSLFRCPSLRRVIIPGVQVVERYAFSMCENLTDVVDCDKLERFGRRAFSNCLSLKRITIPLKDGMITDDDLFHECEKLERVDLVGEVHEAIAALQLEEWRKDVNEEMDRINQILPNTPAGSYFYPGRKTHAIQVWIQSVRRKMEHYKAEHRTLLKEAATTLELALWKSRLCGDNNDVSEGDEKKRAECRNNCGADMSIIIPNVLSFLKIE